MKIESLEQRVANTPAATLCDECIHEPCCEYKKDMRATVVSSDKMCYGKPFKPKEWTCQLYSTKVNEFDCKKPEVVDNGEKLRFYWSGPAEGQKIPIGPYGENLPVATPPYADDFEGQKGLG